MNFLRNRAPWHTAALCLLLAGGALTATAANFTYVNEVTKLKNAGLGDETILSYVNGKNYNYDLNADDILTLQKEGFSAALINAMIASGKDNGVTVARPAIANAPLVPPASMVPTSAPATLNPDAAYFYQELSPYGRWVTTEDGQWCWQPTIIASSPGWRPYYDNGHWVSTDGGWYWTSDYPWAWAAFHYGRWQLHPHFGWIWFPDRVWGPAWVTWRSGGEYCGWAPLPPGAVFDVSVGRFRYGGRLVEANFGFGLDWVHFNFCYVKELGEPLHWHPSGEVEIRTVFTHTLPMKAAFQSGVTVIHGEKRQQFINVGVEPAHVAELRGRPVETMKVQDLHAPIGKDVHEKIVPEDKVLQTYRPGFDHRNDKPNDKRDDNRKTKH